MIEWCILPHLHPPSLFIVLLFYYSPHHSQSSHIATCYQRQPTLQNCECRTILFPLIHIRPYHHPQWPPSAPPHPAFWPPLAHPPSPLSSAAPMQPSTHFPTLAKPCLPLNHPSPQNTPPPSTSPLNPQRHEQRPSTSTAGRLIRLPRSPRCSLTRWI